MSLHNTERGNAYLLSGNMEKNRLVIVELQCY